MAPNSWVDFSVGPTDRLMRCDVPCPNTQRWCQRLARGIGLALLAAGLTVAVSHVWEQAFKPSGLTGSVVNSLQGEFIDGMFPMAFSTGLSFALGGLVLAALATPPAAPARRLVACAAGLLILSGPLDSLLPLAFRHPPKPPMSGFTAALFVVAGVGALAALARANRSCRVLASACASGLAVLTGLFLLGFGYQIWRFVEDSGFTPMARMTASTFLLLAVGLIVALGPDYFPLRPFVGPSPRAMMLRGLLPVVVGFLILGAWIPSLHLATIDTELIDLRVRASLLASLSFTCAVSVAATTLAIWWLSHRIGATIEQAEQKRDEALDRMVGTINDLTKTREELVQAHQQATEANRLLSEANADLAQARDKAEQVSVAKDFFLATVSHELRTPLGHVLGFLQLLELTDLDDSQSRDLAKIRNAANNLLALINDLLDYQRMIQGVLPLEPTVFELRPFVEQIAEAMRPKFAEKGALLLLDCSAEVGALETDDKRVGQALTNLLTNAAKFTRGGKATVIVRRESDGAGDWVRLSVEDTGRGMTPEQQTKLFQPFTKLLARSENPEGTGLGLALSQRLCRLMGGDLTLTRSEPGAGSTFTISLPATSATAQAAALVRPPGQPTPGSHPNKRLSVLVIDDEPEVRELMSRHLGAQGFEVHLAASGGEGLEVVKRLSPDAITLDVLMPGIDGWGTLAALQADHETAHIPVILITMLDDRTRGFALGAWEVLTKPVSWSRLIDLLNTVAPQAGPVLVVDDDPAFCEMGQRTLQEHGYDVCCAHGAREALAAAARRRPSLVLLDLIMPGMDGFEFLNEFRKEADWREVPVVVVTAKDLTAEEQSRLDGSVVGVLSKGMSSPEDVLREVGRLLRSPRSQAAALAAAGA